MIYICGSAQLDDTTTSSFVMRLTTKGSLDTTFGSNGIAIPTPSLNNQATALALQGDGKIVVVGRTWLDPDSVGVMAMRLNTNGALDATFGIGGVGFYDLTPYSDWASSVAIDNFGQILIAGLRPKANQFSDTSFLMRVLENGSLDSSYGEEGIATPTRDVGFDLMLDNSNAAYLRTNQYIIEKFL